jgi:hypothetical protein
MIAACSPHDVAEKLALSNNQSLTHSTVYSHFAVH